MLDQQAASLRARTLLSLTLLLLSAASLVAQEPTATKFDHNKKPNILWLVAEDFGPHLGCYGTREVFTPNLDQMAAEGVRYTKFFTTAPVCSASRSAWMTGMYQTTIGAHNHRSHRDDGYKLPEGVQLLSHRLQKAGYFTANIRETPAAWGFRGSGKTDFNFNLDEPAFESDKWSDLATHQPFYAQINLQETHRNFKAPKRADPAKVEVPPYYPDHEIVRRDWAEYLDAASELDRKVGLVLAQLKAEGLDKNTVVVFFGDNGSAHVRGKQFCYDSGLHVPLIIRWPAEINRHKHMKTQGTVNRDLVAAIDLAATFTLLANVPGWDKMDGKPFIGDFSGPSREYVFGARDRCDETVFRLRTVRSSQYRYIRNFTPHQPLLAANDYKERQYPVWNLLKELAAENKLGPLALPLVAPTMPEEEFYDLEADPHETKNLIADPALKEVIAQHRRQLDQWIDETKDQGAIMEPAEVAKNEGRTKPASPKSGPTKAKGKKKQ